MGFSSKNNINNINIEKNYEEIDYDDDDKEVENEDEEENEEEEGEENDNNKEVELLLKKRNQYILELDDFNLNI